MSGGIIQCFNAWDGICWEKLIKCLLDLAVLIVATVQLALHCKSQFSLTHSKYWLYILISLSVFSNFLHQVFFKIWILFDCSTLFFDIYFVTILYYAGFKLIEDTKNKKWPTIIINILYAISLILQLLLFVSSLIQNDESKCIGIWYLVVRSIGFMLGICLCVVAKLHQNKAQKRLQSLKQISLINNPIPKLWCWVGVNIGSQTINLVKTYIFAFDDSLQCKYDKNSIEVNIVIQLIILITTFYIPLLSTIYIFWVPCRKQTVYERRQSFEQEPIERLTMGVQLISIKGSSKKDDQESF